MSRQGWNHAAEVHLAWLRSLSQNGSAEAERLDEVFRKRRMLPIERPVSPLRRRRIALGNRKPPRRRKQRMTWAWLHTAQVWLHAARAGLAARRAVKRAAGRQALERSKQPAHRGLSIPPPQPPAPAGQNLAATAPTVPIARSGNTAGAPGLAFSAWEQVAREIGYRA